VFLLLFLTLQLGFWFKTHHISPEMGVVPDVPGKQAVKALSFGDEGFYFRVLALDIQNAGDTYGRFTALRFYDFNKLYQWFTLLDTLDAKSDMMPAMASYYFSQTQNTADVRYVADYLYEHGSRDVEHKWWWLMQAIYLGMHKLNDNDFAAKAADKLVNANVPIFAQQMAAVVYEKRGEMDDALRIMETIRDNATTIPDRDLKYMTYFVKERLKRLEKVSEFKKIGEEKREPTPTPTPTPSPTPNPTVSPTTKKVVHSLFKALRS
ncbi:MAG: hypothetical protein EBR02_08240, partial [Alphaproteobacteria bacterium]|nr:hypothetical protein [Alphaproteobacteria bacterium]